MAQILLNVSDGQKVLWVAAAHDDRVSLSEWIRRRCDAGLEGRGGAMVSGGVVAPDPGIAAPAFRDGATLPDVDGDVPRPSSPVLPTSVREFRPDPKKKP